MPPKHRPPMPKLPPFALANVEPPRSRPYYLIVFYLLFALPLFLIHLSVIDLPYFWDEHGQFIPTALDLLRHGWWVAKSTIPNVHPPGVEFYLVIWYKLFGYSIPITRLAMLLLGAAGLLGTFVLAIELSRGTKGTPAFWPPLFLMASPLFYTQSFMAQLDMPAMVFTVLTVLFFLKGKYKEAAVASVVLVLLKETGLVTPFILFVTLCIRRDFIRASYFVAPAAAVGLWLLILHHATGYWLGDPGFTHYNVNYSLHPVRIVLTLVRRLYYLFFAEFRWIGTFILIFTARQFKLFRTPAWRLVLAVFAANVLLVSVLGGAELERYLLPVLPLLYIAVAVGLTALRKTVSLVAAAALLAGLSVSLFWNPPYPFAFENNYAMVDFVHLQKLAAGVVEHDLPDKTIATAWPYTAALARPDYGFVSHRLRVIETNDFHLSSIQAIPPAKFDVLITYTRTWAPESGVIAFPFVRTFLRRFYQWQPPISPGECEALGLHEHSSWSLHGQTIAIYSRDEPQRNLRHL